MGKPPPRAAGVVGHRRSWTAAPSPRLAKPRGLPAWLRKLVLWWPVVNLLLIYALVSHRMLEDVDQPCEHGFELGGALPGEAAGEADGVGCLNDCSGQGLCVDGRCHCLDQFTAEDCSQPQCPRNCSGMGTCLPSGQCICKGRYVGEDCSVDISDLQMDILQHRVGVPFTTGQLEEDIELVINTKSRQLYPRALCHSKQCAFTWATTLMNLGGYLPHTDYRPHFKTCAVINSSKQLVYANITTAKGGDLDGLVRREAGYGKQIDQHYMVMRLDNAPTAGYEKWVGSRTTHRLVQGDYARLVSNMLGTEKVVGSRKTVVTPSTWWAGGYPAVEKVTYLMSVPGTPMSGGKELRAPEHSGYSAFMEVFPGNRRMLLSPVFLRRVAEVNDRVRRTLGRMSLDCVKGSQEGGQPASPLLVALLFALQSCDQVDVYGVSVGRSGARGPEPQLERIVRDSNFRMHVKGVSNKAECCYHPLEEDYVPEVSLCDEITRRFSLRMLQESGRVNFYA